MDLPLKQIKNLLKTLEDGGAAEFEYEDEKVRVRISMARGAPLVTAAQLQAAPAQVPVTTSAAAAASAAKKDEGDPSVVFITSPFVGTFYRRPNPDSPEYVKVNDKVRKGQVLCIVEAMKLMNEIEADVDGTIVGILAEDGAPVEYGQPLFKIAS